MKFTLLSLLAIALSSVAASRSFIIPRTNNIDYVTIDFEEKIPNPTGLSPCGTSKNITFNDFSLITIPSTSLPFEPRSPPNFCSASKRSEIVGGNPGEEARLTIADPQKYCSFDIYEAYVHCAASTGAGVLSYLVDCRLRFEGRDANGRVLEEKVAQYEPEALADLPLPIPDVTQKQRPLKVDFRNQGFDRIASLAVILEASSVDLGGPGDLVLGRGLDSLQIGLRKC